MIGEDTDGPTPPSINTVQQELARFRPRDYLLGFELALQEVDVIEVVLGQVLGLASDVAILFCVPEDVGFPKPGFNRTAVLHLQREDDVLKAWGGRLALWLR